jgi:hypothetical protein
MAGDDHIPIVSRLRGRAGDRPRGAASRRVTFGVSTARPSRAILISPIASPSLIFWFAARAVTRPVQVSSTAALECARVRSCSRLWTRSCSRISARSARAAGAHGLERAGIELGPTHSRSAECGDKQDGGQKRATRRQVMASWLGRPDDETVFTWCHDFHLDGVMGARADLRAGRSRAYRAGEVRAPRAVTAVISSNVWK